MSSSVDGSWFQRLTQWFAPAPPISTSSRVEIDRWLLAISETVGSASMDVSPARAVSVGNDLSELVGRLCQAAAIDSSLVDASFVETRPGGSPIEFHALDDGVTAIAMDDGLRQDHTRCVVGVAQGVAISRWRSVTGQTPSDPIRDLMVVAMGLGDLAADAFLYDQTWSALGMQGWEMSRMGTLNSQEIGYAMATWDRITASVSQAPVKHLRLDARVAHRQSLAYYRSVGALPTLVDDPKLPSIGGDDGRVLSLWNTGEASRVYASAIATKNRLDQSGQKLPAKFVPPLFAMARSADLDLATVGTRLLGYVTADSSLGDLLAIIKRSLKHSSDAVFLAAVASSMDHGQSIDRFGDRLAGLAAVQSGDQFVSLDLLDRASPLADRVVTALERELAAAEKYEDDIYADRLRQTLLEGGTVVPAANRGGDRDTTPN